MADEFNPDRYTPAGQRLLAEYQAQKTPFDVATRPYYSSGSIAFELVNYAAGPPLRQFAIARAGQQIQLFSYARNTDVSGVNLGARNATVADTNMSVASETNNEDFCIEGLSITCRGFRTLSSPAIPPTDPDVRAALAGQLELSDISSTLQPPEISSPLALEEALWEVVKRNISLTSLWDLKASDLLGMASEVPEGGAKSYLRASGDPLNSNFMRIPEGFIWRNTRATNDKLFNLTIKVENPIIFLLTNAPLVPLDVPTKIWCDFLVRLHGTAFYYPSTN